MSRSPFFPALFALLFSSLFSFATTAAEGDWERLDGGARLRLKLDSDGRLHASLTEAQIGTQHTPIAGQAPRRRTFRGLRLWFSLVLHRHQRAGGPVYTCATRRQRLGSASLHGSDRLHLKQARSRETSEWKRIS